MLLRLRQPHNYGSCQQGDTKKDGDEGLIHPPDGGSTLQVKLHRSEVAARDLRSCLNSERENGLDWMEQHNKERDKVKMTV